MGEQLSLKAPAGARLTRGFGSLTRCSCLAFAMNTDHWGQLRPHTAHSRDRARAQKCPGQGRTWNTPWPTAAFKILGSEMKEEHVKP